MLALFVLTTLTILGTLVLNSAIVEIKMAQNQKVSSQVFYAAEAGLERGMLMLITDFENDTGVWGNSNYAGWAESVTETAVGGSTTFDPAVRSLDMYLDASTTSVKQLTLGGGNQVERASFDLYIYKVSSDEAYVMSHATGLGGQSAVEYHLKVVDMSPYNNAIFTGAGVSGHFQGSVNLAGSVYSRGNLDVGANVKIVNSYGSGHSPPGPGDTIYDILDQTEGADLNTKVRVRGGDLTLAAGSTQIGDPGDYVEGIWVDGAFNQGTASVYSDDYQTEVPDVPMPSILDGLEGLFDDQGWDFDACLATKAGTDAQKAMDMYQDYANGTGCLAAEPTRGAVVSGNITIDKNTATGWLAGPDAAGNGLYYTKYSGSGGMGTIDVKGTVVVTGNLSFGDNKLDGLYYTATGPDTGSGSDPTKGANLVVGGDFTATGSFYPPNGYLKGDDLVTNDVNSLGVVTPGSITFEGHNADTHAGFFYAETQVNFNKQSKFAGTVIGGLVNYSQVPDVYQVPALKDYLPPGMPGGYAIVNLSDREWRRVY